MYVRHKYSNKVNAFKSLKILMLEMEIVFIIFKYYSRAYQTSIKGMEAL